MSPGADVGIYEDEEEEEERWVSWDPAARRGVFTLLAHPASCNADPIANVKFD